MGVFISVANGPGLTFPSQYIPAGLPTNQLSTWKTLYSEVLGIVSQPQNLYTRSGPNLTLQPPGSFMYDQSVIASYNLYATDTWHMKPSVTLSYGLGYQLEMPPYELNGKQVMLTDATLRLVDDLGLTPQLVPSSDLARVRWIVRRGRLRRLPAKLPQFLASDVLSFPGRMRVLLEWAQPARRGGLESAVQRGNPWQAPGQQQDRGSRRVRPHLRTAERR